MGAKRTILAVDDEPKITEVVKSYLESKGYRVIAAATGRQALCMMGQEPVSLVLLDLMLPDISGEAVCAELRRHSDVPIIMLTAKTGEEDLLSGLGVGADDYITKPFSLRALHARVEAVLRRAGGVEQRHTACVRYGGLTIDTEQCIVKKYGREVKLTPNEYKLLEGLAARPNKVFTREEIIALVLGGEYEGYDRTIDSHIKNLRKKMEDDPKNPVYVKTIRGMGYKFGGE